MIKLAFKHIRILTYFAIGLFILFLGLYSEMILSYKIEFTRIMSPNDITRNYKLPNDFSNQH